MVDCSVGADGLVYLLFSGHVPERINGMFVDTRANAHYRGIGLAVDWQDGTVLGWEPYDFGVQEMNFHFIQPIGEDILLLGSRSRCYRDGSVDQNAVVVDKNGRKLREMCLGDGIQSCAVACDGRIITSYFDEGVFGNFGWDRPVGSCGLIVWDRNGQPIWKNKTYPIWDCYAMNLDDQENLWFYYYSEFNLVRMNLNAEMSKSEKDKARIDQLNAEMRTLYAEIMKNPHMLAFSAAKDEVDKLANQINTILMMAINGEDPDEIDVSAAGCGGNCSSCSGCGQ